MNLTGKVLIAIVMLATTPDVVQSQQVKPAGVVAATHPESATTPPLRADLSVLVDSTRGHPLLWVGSGAVLGGAAAGIAATVSASRTDDGFLVGQAIGLAAVAGAVVGGLVGGLAYLISR